jgi:hypothetical protein
MASEEEELAQISDYVVAILRSPTWVSPISKFVDDNCGIFEDAEENKLEYTFVHNAFKQLVDDLLVAHLCEMSLSTEQFMRFCERGLSGNNQLHRSLVEQLISVDDFLVFKAMMVKRSCELDREVLGPPLTNAALPSSDDQALSALEQPQDTAGEEVERLEAERRCVEAELQLAEALSLQLEKRLQLMEALDEVLDLVSKIYRLRADALEQQVVEEKAREQELLQQAAAENMLAQPVANIAPAPILQAPATLAPVQHKPHLAPVISTTVSVRPLNEAPPLPAIPNYAGMGGMPSLATSNPNEILNIERKKTEAALQKQRAEQASAAKRQEMTAIAAPAAAPYYAEPSHQYGFQAPLSAPLSAPAAPLQPSEQEKLARAEHLKRQRTALIEKKNRERESQLAMFQVNSGGPTKAALVAERALQQPPQPSPQEPDAGKRLAEELSGLARAQPGAPQIANPDTAAAEMRRMLTRQLKNSFQQ